MIFLSVFAGIDSICGDGALFMTNCLFSAVVVF